MDAARAVVIGGGVVGLSVAYHLTRKGWRDVVVCEQAELATGASAHAAGHVILYTLNPTVARLNHYGVGLYSRLKDETGFDPGFHRCGNLRVATHPDRLLEFRRYMGFAAVTGIEAHLLNPSEVVSLWPMMQTEGILGAVLNPTDGHMSGSDLAQALGAGARQGGATIRRDCAVTGVARQGNRWRVETSKGPIRCEHVVSATGNYANRTARMIGRTSCAVPVRHQYIVTEPILEIADRRHRGLPEFPVTRDPEGCFYFRQDGDALVVGAYDGRGNAMFVDDVPEGYGSDPLPDQLDKLLPYLERAVKRLPLLETAGFRRVVNSPMPYAPDDLPICGPAFGLKNYWLAEGNPFGITLAGGIGWQIAEWIAEGAPSINMSCCDSRRFGPWASRDWAARKVEEAYEHTYLLPKPDEELPAGRNMRLSPLHGQMVARGAVFGVEAGWEQPIFFGRPEEDQASFSRPGWLHRMRDECVSAAKGVALADISAGSRFLICGTQAAGFLRDLAGLEACDTGACHVMRLPVKAGGVGSDVLVYRAAADRFYLSGSAATELADLDLLHQCLHQSVTVNNLTDATGALLLIGPDAAAVLAQYGSGVAAAAEFDDGQGLELGDLIVMRHDRFGLPTWEVHGAPDPLREFFLELAQVPSIGAHALRALGLTHPAKGLHLLRIDVTNYPPLGLEPVRGESGAVIGQTIAGGWGPDGETAFAHVRVEPEQAANGLEVQIMGDWRRATPMGAAAGLALPDNGRTT